GQKYYFVPPTTLYQSAVYISVLLPLNTSYF
ncbi:hypothetical protein [truncated ORF], partial [Aspergillus niger]|uniref:Uncharacterized protein n=2 Tax=Aspergillus niger TaxID=5061 RepID=A0AAJ8BPH6_ASPNG